VAPEVWQQWVDEAVEGVVDWAGVGNPLKPAPPTYAACFIGIPGEWPWSPEAQGKGPQRGGSFKCEDLHLLSPELWGVHCSHVQGILVGRCFLTCLCVSKAPVVVLNHFNVCLRLFCMVIAQVRARPTCATS
jgi:hypothetical protein